MTVTDSVVYVHGGLESSGLAPRAALDAARAHDGLAWIGLISPTDAEVTALGAELGLHPLGVRESLRAHQRSKFEQYDGDLFLVLQPARYDDQTESVYCHEVDVFVADNLIVTVTVDGEVDVAQARERFARDPEILAAGPLGVLWAVCERVTRGYRDVLDGVEHDIDEIEEELFGEEGGVSHRIFALQREVIDLHHATAPLEEILDRLRALAAERGRTTEEAAFLEVADRARYVEGRVSAFRQTLDNALTIHATLVEQRRNAEMAKLAELGARQNDQVKKVSSWAAIGFAPTLVAGVYGMNFAYMPELGQPWGYPFALGLMVAVSAALYVVFKKNDWL